LLLSLCFDRTYGCVVVEQSTEAAEHRVARMSHASLGDRQNLFLAVLVLSRE
jgi:hypothetical protein